jgi:predicted Zn-dependent protease with MMP-like domain
MRVCCAVGSPTVGRRRSRSSVRARDFDKVVERALRRIPSRFRKRVENVVIVVEREPRRAGLLGLYHGRPLTERSDGAGFGLPDQITIYQGPHERMARDETHLEELVAETVWHEIAHYFGMDEAQVRRAERRRKP